MKRASIEPNFHKTYSSFIEVICSESLYSDVIAETYKNIRWGWGLLYEKEKWIKRDWEALKIDFTFKNRELRGLQLSANK